jgi:hypothetical protein
VYYKVLNEDGTSCHGGQCTWSLPTQNDDGTWTPGEWMPAIKGALEPCENGYHLCRGSDLLDWLGPVICEAEYCGEMVEAVDKIVVREARLLRRLNWDERVARLLACDCAEHVLHVFETARPHDPRPRQTIEVSRRYANGEATDEQLTAARAAAWDAVVAARAAARAAAWAAAGAAARAAAGDDARAAAWAAQAAWAAAWAAWDAATAAWAARVAAGAAVSTAGAASAASAAERQWQTERLLADLEGRP